MIRIPGHDRGPSPVPSAGTPEAGLFGLDMTALQNGGVTGTWPGAPGLAAVNDRRRDPRGCSLQKLQHIVRHVEDILSAQSVSSLNVLRESLDQLDARQRFYIRQTLERARAVDRTLLVHLITMKYLVEHWHDQDTATKVAVLWCIDSLAETEFARAVLQKSPEVSEIFGKIQERLAPKMVSG